MKLSISRWFLFGLLLGWSLTHASVFGQGSGTTSSGSTPAAKPAKDGSAEKLRAALDKKITIDFTGNSLNDGLNHFRDKSGLAVHIDPHALAMLGFGDGNDGNPGVVFPPGAPGVPIQQPGQGQFRIKATDEKAGTVLRRMLSPYRLTYVIFEDALLITTEEMALVRQYRQRVSVDLEEVSFKKAVRDLAKSHGISLVIDPKVAKQSDTAVTLQLENTGIETALRLLAELAGLKAVRMGNVMFVTTEEKAKRIREEEPFQFDNPLNPNIPGGGGPPVFQGAIGGFGGIAMPARVAPAVQAFPVPVNPDAPPVPPGLDLPVQPPVEKAPGQSTDPAPAKKRIIEINPQQGGGMSSTTPGVIAPPAQPRDLPPARND